MNGSSSRQLVISASTQARLQAARGWLGTFPRDREVLILVPHAIAADHLVHNLVAHEGSRFGLQRLTLSRLAERVAAPELARRGAVPCTSLSLAAISARAVHRVVKEGRGGLFAAVALRPGFPRALAETFEDLRGAAVPLRHMQDVVSAAPLAPFLQAIEEELLQSQVFDQTEMFQIAVHALEERRAWPERRRRRRQITHYSLDVVISVGYRVNSRRAVQLRHRATGPLRDHLVQGDSYRSPYERRKAIRWSTSTSMSSLRAR